MTDASTTDPRERALRLRYEASCRDCGRALAAGERACWDAASRTVRCLACPTDSATAEEHAHDWGTAGASAQREFDRREGRRRGRLRSRWPWLVVVAVAGATVMGAASVALHWPPTLFVAAGALLPVLSLLERPQHVDAWRSGAVGEREVGARLDALRTTGVITLHDRRVPGRRTNIDHIAVSPTGVFVIDTKNVAGKVSVTGDDIYVAGRRRDSMVTGVQGQLAVVRQALEDQSLDPASVRGVLCFPRADLPWSRATSGGVALLSPRRLVRMLRRPGPLSDDEVQELASVLAQRLPVA